MAKLRIPILLLALVVLAALAAPVIAPAQQPVGGPAYTIQPGDTLWELAGVKLDDPRQWRVIVEKNTFLQEPGRIFERGGKIIALIRPGEKLDGLAELGIMPRVYPLPESPRASDTTISRSDIFWWVALVFLTLLAVAVAVSPGFPFHWLRRRASATGIPVVDGGIPPEEPERIAARFDTIAGQRYAAVNPLAGTEARPQRIGPIENGFLSGGGRVQYRDRVEERRLHSEPAYRARFRFPDGREEDLFFLSACANDVTIGGARYSGFQWEPRQIVAAAPPPPAPVVPLRVAGEGPEPDLTTVTVGTIEFQVPRGFAVTHDDDGRIRVTASGPGELVVRQRPRVKSTRKAKPKAAAGVASA